MSARSGWLTGRAQRKRRAGRSAKDDDHAVAETRRLMIELGLPARQAAKRAVEHLPAHLQAAAIDRIRRKARDGN
jgi:hypothetical protein